MGSQGYATIEGLTGWADSTGKVHLEWHTRSENAYGFEVQKSVFAEEGYQTVPNGFVPAVGGFLVETRYAFTDRFALPGAWYYRLALVGDFGLVQAEVRWTQGIFIEVP
jgi:hypothetical protein